MINLYTIERIGDFISAIMTIYFFNRILPSKNKKYCKLYSVIMIILYILIPAIITNNIVLTIEYNRMLIFISICYCFVLIYPFFFRRGRGAEKFFLSLLYITIKVISSLIIFIIISIIFEVTFAEIAIYINYERIIATLVNRIIQFILIWIFLNNMNFIKYIESKTLYVGGIILILNHILILIIERGLIKNFNIIDIDIIYILSSLCAIQILLIIMLNAIAKQVEKKFMLKMSLDREIHDEEIMDMYTKMMGWKHDFSNHISMILGLLEIEEKEEAILYIN